MITGQRLLGPGRPVGLTIESDGDLRRVLSLAAAAADAQGFDETSAERVRIVASEMAANLVQHARSGRIFVRLLERGVRGGVELVATDEGPGMHVKAPGFGDRRPTIEASDRTGHLSGAEVTGGLAAISRASDLFDLYTAPGQGTVMMSRHWGGKLPAAADGPFLVGSMMAPHPGEDVSGDAWAVEGTGTRVVALVADGLGHGAEAAAASGAATVAFRERHREPAEQIMRHVHGALRGTRGAAVAVAEVDPALGRLRFCGIGNISARLLLADTDRSLISHFGIAGYQSPRIRAYDQVWEDGAVLVMHSDGLANTWDLDDYKGLLGRHPQLAAAMVMRDAPRASDDALVLTLRAENEADRPPTAEPADE